VTDVTGARRERREIARHILDVSANPSSNAKQMSSQMCLFYQRKTENACIFLLYLSEQIMINEFFMLVL